MFYRRLHFFLFHCSHAALFHYSDFETSTDGESDIDAYKKAAIDSEGNQVYNGITVTRAGLCLPWLLLFLTISISHKFFIMRDEQPFLLSMVIFVLCFTERRADKTRLYNFSKVRKSRKWLKVMYEHCPCFVLLNFIILLSAFCRMYCLVTVHQMRKMEGK